MSSRRLDWKDSGLSQPDEVQVLFFRTKCTSWSAGAARSSVLEGNRGKRLSRRWAWETPLSHSMGGRAAVSELG